MIRQFKLPDLGEGIYEGEIVEVLISPGDQVEEGQAVLVVETDKAAVEIPSPCTGVVKQVRVKPHDVVHVDEVMLEFEVEGAEKIPGEKEEKPASRAEAPPAAKAPPKPAAGGGKGKGPVPASPATRRLARELGVDLAEVTASGPGGLVTAEDVRAYAEKAPQIAREEKVAPPEGAVEEAAAKAPALPDFSGWGEVERVPLRSVRKVMARRMALSWSRVPHVSHQDVADVTELETVRKKHKEEVENLGGRLTLTVFALKAATACLKAYPRFNSSLDHENEEIVLKHYYHLGVATDTERGLVVPVVKDVDGKNMMELSVELPRLTRKAREGKLTLEDVRGGTFTITNIGPLGGTAFNPIINYPEVAILGLGQARWQPVVRRTEEAHEIVPRLMLPLVLTFDHRVIDGAEGARFMNLIKEFLEDPTELLFST